MVVSFHKYHGAGNDFIIIDNRNNQFPNNRTEIISKLCNRQFGIGADGLMLLSIAKEVDFDMKYFNSDGNEGTLCGNGGRCITAYAYDSGIIKENMDFLAIDGRHIAVIVEKKGNSKTIKLKMNDVNNIEDNKTWFFLNTGSPHYVQYVENVEEYDVFNKGRSIRNSGRFSSEGTNVNFIEQKDSYLFVRTYERGVENETLSCGTGVTASAIISAVNRKMPYGINEINVKTTGGFLKVQFERVAEISFRNIWLEGPATFVFKGEIEI
jgi:diaminopimelate epimerase